MATAKILPPDDQDRSSSSQYEFPPCGYVIHDMDKAEERLKCIFCTRINKEPIQFLECGHRACRGCYESRAVVAPDSKITCPDTDCKYSFDRSQTMVDRAFKRELDALPVICMYKTSTNCSWRGTLQAYQEHLDELHSRFACKYCSEVFSNSHAVTEHETKSCPGLFERCPLAPYCGEELVRKHEFEAHMLTEKHQEAMALAITGKYIVPGGSGEHDHDMETNADPSELETEVTEKVNVLAEQVQTLNDNTVKLSQDFIKLNALCQVATQEASYLEASCAEKMSQIAGLQPMQDAIQKDIDQLNVSIEESQYIFMDGTLLWRVDRVAEQMADAQSDRRPSIFSPIFYSTPHGYKMQARLYLHGDGNARRTHISLFFRLLKGSYDAILPWPFSHKVTFCLFDQTGNNRHIIDSFRPDVKSASFQKPTTDANIASGIPKFFPLPMIQQDDNAYVRDDTLFLKIIVDLSDTPKAVLPYMLTLNPGLPVHVQQHLVNVEKNKQQQQQQQQDLNANVATST